MAKQDDQKSPPTVRQRAKWLFIVGLPLIAFYWAHATKLWDRIFVPPGINSVALNRTDDCRAGVLREEVSRYLDRSAEYTYQVGAEALRICATQTIQSQASTMATAIADAFPGCIQYWDINDTFRMIANPDAICRVISGDNVRYVCDGARPSARSHPTTQSQPENLPVCRPPIGF